MARGALTDIDLTVTIILLLAAPEKYPIMVTGMEQAEEAATANGITAAIILAITGQQVFA